MCTSFTFKTKDFYFARTLDYFCSFKEKVIICKRNYPFKFKEYKTILNHYAIIGLGALIDNYPFYFDACNEKGLCMAGLNFVGYAKYNSKINNKINITPYEFIPYILSTCSNIDEAYKLIENINLVAIPYNDELPISELHFIISDKNKSLTIESTINGLKIYDNKIGILTNNPTFDFQMFALNNYIHLTSKDVINTFSQRIELDNYSLGLGCYGLPGDFSSQSRFVKTAYIKYNSICNDDEISSINQCFQIMDSVAQVDGCIINNENKYFKTLFKTLYNATKGIYYYTTATNRQVNAVLLNNIDLNGTNLKAYEINHAPSIKYCN